jgi:hypothetical protein
MNTLEHNKMLFTIANTPIVFPPSIPKEPNTWVAHYLKHVDLMWPLFLIELLLFSMVYNKVCI